MSKSKTVVLGSRNQSSIIYGNFGGNQCVANTTSCFCYTTLHGINDIKKQEIDTILDSGNMLYGQIRKNVPQNYLTPTNVPSEFIIHGMEFRHELNVQVCGLLGGTKDELMGCLTEAFSHGHLVYFIYNEFAIGIQSENGVYYIFDPHSRSAAGLPTPSGRACVIKFVKFTDVTNHIKRLYNLEEERQFDLFCCKLTELRKETFPRKDTVLFLTRNLVQYSSLKTILANQCSVFGHTMKQPKVKCSYENNENKQSQEPTSSYWKKPRKSCKLSSVYATNKDTIDHDIAIVTKSGETIGVGKKRKRVDSIDTIDEISENIEMSEDSSDDCQNLKSQENKTSNVKKVYKGKPKNKLSGKGKATREHVLVEKETCFEVINVNKKRSTTDEDKNDNVDKGFKKPISKAKRRKSDTRNDNISSNSIETDVSGSNICCPEKLCNGCSDTVTKHTEIVKEIKRVEGILKRSKLEKTIKRLQINLQSLRNKLFFADKDKSCINFNTDQIRNEQLTKKEFMCKKKAKKSHRKKEKTNKDVCDSNIPKDDNIRSERNIEIIDENSFVQNKYEYKDIDEPLEYVCCVCYQMLFEKSITHISDRQRHIFEPYLRDDYKEMTVLVICHSCRRSVIHNKMPKLAYKNGMSFPELPYELDIFPGEERLISLRLPFMHIKSLPQGMQLSLLGNVINVPARIESGIIRLPRYINKEGTVCVRIKKRLRNTAVYKTINVRPHRVLRSLKWLIENSNLYKESTVEIDHDWLENTLTELLEQDICGIVSNDIDISDDNLTFENVNDHVQNEDESHGNEDTRESSRLIDIGEDVEQDFIDNNHNLYENVNDNDHFQIYCIYSDNDMELLNYYVEKNMNIMDMRNKDTGLCRSVFQNSDKLLECIRKSKTEENLFQNDIYSDTEINELEEEDDFIEFDEIDEQVQFDTFVDDAEILEFLDVAPAEYEVPRYILYDEHSEELAFPTIYAGKKKQEIYPSRISFSNRVRWELRSDDNRVRRNPEKIFFMYKIYQMEAISSSHDFSVRSVKGGSQYIAENVRTAQQKKNLSKVDRGYFMFKKLRNSPQYLNARKKDILGMIRQLGLPTWFMSLSAADTKWGILLANLVLIVDKVVISPEDAENLNWKEKCRLMNSDPVTCARYFDNRFLKFLNNVLRDDTNPIGEVTDYFYKIEFQHRGSPHVHMLVFCKDTPEYSRLHSNQDICDYVDKYVSCSSRIDDDLKQYLNYQTHRHSKTCKKGKKAQCRFNFPIAPFNETVLLHPNETLNRIDRENLISIQKYLDSTKANEKCTLEMMLKDLDLSEEDYIRAVQSSLTEPRIFLKRRPCESRINGYMKNLIHVYKANHDIQFCLNSYAVVMYIVNYIQKVDRGVSLGLKKINEMYKKKKMSLHDEIKSIGDVFLKYSEISIQECIYMLLGFHMTSASRLVTVVSTKSREERLRVLKKAFALADLDDDSDDIYCADHYDNYKNRPDILFDWTFAEFITNVNKVKTRKKIEIYNSDTESDDCENDDNDECDQNKRALYSDNNWTYYKRKKRKILRYFCPCKTEDKEDYYRIHLLLFYPWIDENQIMTPFESYEDRFTNLSNEERTTILDLSASYNKQNINILIELANEIEDYDDDIDIAPSTQHETRNINTDDHMEITNYNFFKPEKATIPDVTQIPPNSNIDEPIYPFETVNELWNLQNLLETYRNLNEKQQYFVDSILTTISNPESEALRIFCSGSGGTGKSVVLKFLYQALSRFYGSMPNVTGNPVFVRCIAFTGKAAFLVGGETMHSALGFKYKQSYKYYTPLTMDKLNTLRAKNLNLKVLLIDEVSLIGCNMLNCINLRLQEICGSRERFGGIHIIAFGDLYQLPPVQDSWIFSNLDHPGGVLAPNVWKEEFRFYELTEIMRQKDDIEFAEILGRIRVGKYTESDINILKKRNIVREKSEHKHILHLFHTNEAVNQYNSICFDKMEGEKTKVTATDVIQGAIKKEEIGTIIKLIPKESTLTANLCKVLELGIGLHYELLHNLDVSDGLANGTTGQLKYIEYIENYDKPAILWIKFEFSSIGIKQRENYKHYQKAGIVPDWTPIFSLTRVFKLNRDGITVHRTQFPLKQCAARTIHKSQGSTVDAVVIEMGDKVPRHMFYVAISRVQKLKGVFLKNFSRNLIKVDELVNNEMKRLKKYRILDLNFHRLDYKSENTKLVYFNAQSYHKHFKQVLEDPDIKGADIICCVESRLMDTDKSKYYEIPGFYIFRFDQKQENHNNRPYSGIIVYVGKDTVVCSSSRIDHPLIQAVILNCLSKNKNIYIVILYKSPRGSLSDLIACAEYINALCTENYERVIIGDFNMNISEGLNKNTLNKLEKIMKCKQYVKEPTTKWGNTIDLCFSNIEIEIECHYKLWTQHHNLLVIM